MDQPQALQIIQREHEALAAVLRTLPLLLRDARRHRTRPDFAVLRAMLFYIEEFPEKLHHVKETTMLFPRLRQHTSEGDEALARLDREHAQGPEKLRDLSHQLTAWELLGETRREAFESALEPYVRGYLAHMRFEEEVVLPLALRVFGEEDWHILNRAFSTHRDALTGQRPEGPYEALFSTITRITPAPYGLADAQPG